MTEEKKTDLVERPKEVYNEYKINLKDGNRLYISAASWTRGAVYFNFIDVNNKIKASISHTEIISVITINNFDSDIRDSEENTVSTKDETQEDRESLKCDCSCRSEETFTKIAKEALKCGCDCGCKRRLHPTDMMEAMSILRKSGMDKDKVTAMSTLLRDSYYKELS